MYPIQAGLYVIGVCACEGILLTRSAAVWENSKPVLGALVGLLVFGFSVAIFSVVKYGEVNITAGLKPAYGAMVNYLCPSEVAMAGTAHYLAYPWILCLIFETILVCLILPKAIAQQVFGRTELYNALYVKGRPWTFCSRFRCWTSLS